MWEFWLIFYMNKEHWISVVLDGSVGDGKTLDFLDMSYDLIDTGRKKFFKYPLGIEINLKGIFLLSDIQGRIGSFYLKREASWLQ